MSQHDYAGPVTVFKTNDPALLAFAQSLLDGADIDFVVAGAVVTGLTPGGCKAVTASRKSRFGPTTPMKRVSC